VNKTFCSLFGLIGEECQGKDLDDLITPAPFAAESDSMCKMVLSGNPLSVTALRQVAAGRLVRVFLTVAEVTNEKKRNLILFIFRPVPPESVKRHSDQIDGKSLEHAFENSCEPSLITDLDGQIVQYNSAFCTEFQWQGNSLPGNNVTDLLIPRSILPEADYINAMTVHGRSLRLQTIRKDSHGNEHRISLICTPSTDRKVHRVYRTADSISLTESNLRNASRFKVCPGPLPGCGMLFQSRTDRNRTMEFIAPGSAAFTGFSEEELLDGSATFGSLILEIDREMVLRNIQDSMKTGSEYSITYRIRNSSDRILWVMELGRAFSMGSNYIDFCEGCIIDVTGTREEEGHSDGAREGIERLHTVAGDLQKSRSIGEIYRICAEAGQSILDGVCSCIFLQDDSRMKLVASSGKDDYPCDAGCSLGMAEVALNTPGPCYFRSRDRAEGFCPAGTSGACFRLGDKAVFQVMSKSSRVFGNVDARILELLLGYTEQGLKRIALQHQLISQALHDPLTGIYNRNYFNRLIQLEEHRARRLDAAISFIMVDVDNFKSINDRYGHQAGDRVLQEVAGVLERALRKTDTVLRYGGDEFLIILTRMTKDYTHVVEARIMNMLGRSEGLEELEGEKITVSMGHAFWTPDSAESINEILKIADLLMLNNKRDKPRKQ